MTPGVQHGPTDPYEVGYRDGESNVEADWVSALGEWCALPAGEGYVTRDVYASEVRYRQAVRRLRRRLVALAVLVVLAIAVTVLDVQAHHRAERKRRTDTHCLFDEFGGMDGPGCP